MDEPSTGLDPASRSNLWSVVKRAKQNRAIILTSTLSLSLSLHMSVIDKMSFFPSGCRWSHPTGLVLHMLDNTITAQWHLEPLEYTFNSCFCIFSTFHGRGRGFV